MTDEVRTEPRTIPLANQLLTNVGLPAGAFFSTFIGVLMIGLFALLLHPDAAIEGPGGALAPWGCALVGSFCIFVGCNGVFIWHRERERLRRWRDGDI
jgi:hypothetical protein